MDGAPGEPLTSSFGLFFYISSIRTKQSWYCFTVAEVCALLSAILVYQAIQKINLLFLIPEPVFLAQIRPLLIHIIFYSLVLPTHI